MKILLIENDSSKANHIIEILEDSDIPIHEIDKKESFQSGLKAAIENKYDILLLDMSIPIHDLKIGIQSDINPKGGMNILKELKRKNISLAVIVITQFEDFSMGKNKVTLNDLKNEMSTEFDNYKHTILYVKNRTVWQNDLIKCVKKIMNYV